MSTYRHPLHDEMVKHIRQGLSDPSIARALGIGRKTVARARHLEGLPAFSAARTLDQKLAAFCQPIVDGHTLWYGPRATDGRPIVMTGPDEKYTPVARVVFERKHSRPPVGFVRETCDFRFCLTASHLLDDIGRRTLYLQTRILLGLGGPWAECPVCGADWETFGRVQPNFQIYCAACSGRRNRPDPERTTP